MISRDYDTFSLRVRYGDDKALLSHRGSFYYGTGGMPENGAGEIPENGAGGTPENGAGGMPENATGET